jgi:hypothetical protein
MRGVGCRWEVPATVHNRLFLNLFWCCRCAVSVMMPSLLRARPRRCKCVCARLRVVRMVG